MKKILLVALAILCFTEIAIAANPGYKKRWDSQKRAGLIAAFDQAWSVALESQRIDPGLKKPKVIFFDESEAEDCQGLAIKTESETLTFCSAFLAANAEYQKFLIHHEVGHYAQHHLDQSNETPERRRLVECEANVFAGQSLGPKFVISVLKKWKSQNENTDVYIEANTRSIDVLLGKRTDCRD